MTKKIKESTVAGSVAVVPAPLGNMQKRAGSMFKGKKTKKKFYESPQFTSKQQVIDYFVRKGKTAKQGAAAWERGYRGTKKATPPSHWLDRAEKAQQDREDQKSMSEQTNKKVPRVYQPFVPAVGKRLEFHDPNTGLLMSSVTVTNIDNDLIYFQDDETGFEYHVNKKDFDPQTLHEREINEQDLIIVPGQGHRLKPGLIPKDKDRTDHEVEMALSDLYQSAKNAKMLYDMIKNISEEQGLEGWVQEKIIKASDYLNTVREYMEHRSTMHEASLKQMLKTTARKLDPTMRGRLAAQSYDRNQYARTMRNMAGDDLSPEGKGITSREERHADRLRRLANKENPFTGQPKVDEMTGGVLAGGMSNFEEGVAETAHIKNKLCFKKIKSEQELVEHAKLFAKGLRMDGVPVTSKNRHTVVCSTIFAHDKKSVTESKHISSGKELIKLLQRLDQFKRLPIKVGTAVAIINSQLQGDSVELWGFTTPKVISKIYRDPADKSIKQFEFNNDPDDVWPRTENAEYNGQFLMYSAFFGDKKSADHAVTTLMLHSSGELDIRNHITEQGVAEEQAPMFTPEEKHLDEKKDACYSKVKSRYKVWPSAYASGALVQCRKVGSSNWGNKSKK